MSSVTVNHNIYQLFEDRFPENRDALFIETPTGDHYSYATLEAETARLANALRGLGLHKGDRVAVQVEKSPQAVFLYLACLRAGYIYLPLNTAYTESELAYFIDNASPGLLVCRPQTEATLSQLARDHGVPHILTLDADGQGSLSELAEQDVREFETVDCEQDDVAVILYTSGTTGRPKGAMITHANLAANGLALQQVWGWQRHDVLLHALPIFHIHGLFVACHSVLLGGSKMLFLPRFDAATVIQLLPEASVLMGVPTFYTRLLDQPELNREACRTMRLFISGSAPLLEQTFTEFRQRTGHTILERYGMTETGMNTSNPLDGERIAGTVGLPLPGVEVRIVDEHNQPVAPGDVGQLQVRGKNVFKGYWGMPDKTAEEFTEDGFFKTGDMARRDSHNYIAIVGRGKDMIITGGFNVYPKEVELLIDELPGIKESAVIGLPHADFGEAVTAVIVPDHSRPLPEETQLITTLKEKLASYKVPKRFVVVEQLPRNTMGKVQKTRLRDEYAGLYQ